MGIFSHFKEQEERLDALEDHVRLLTEAVQQNQIDLATGLLGLLSLQAQVDGKVSTSDVDPVIKEINEKLGVAREQYQHASASASESWAKLQVGVQDSLTKLRASAESARARLAGN